MIKAFKQSYSGIVTHSSIQIHLQEIEEEFTELESILEEMNLRINPSHQLNNMLERMQEFIIREK